MNDTKRAYVSPPVGSLEVTIIRDANPRVTINLDLGIPNFTVFSMTIPLVEDQPRAMSGLIAESVHVLMDEVATFMMSMEYEEEIIVQIYATVLTTFKGMSKESDSSKEQDRTGADPIVRTFEGTFKLPVAFVNETQQKVVTAAAHVHQRLLILYKRLTNFLNERKKKDYEGAALHEYQWADTQKLYAEAMKFFPEDRSLFDQQRRDMNAILYAVESAKEDMHNAILLINHNAPEIAAHYETNAIQRLTVAIGDLMSLQDPEMVARDEAISRALDKDTIEHFAATKIQRSPKVRHIELTYDPKRKNTVSDTARVIRQYRNRSLKQQPKPLYVIVYDQMGRPSGTLALGPKFKNQLLSLTTKRAAVEFISPISFPDEQTMKTGLLPPGVPEMISVGGMTYLPEAVAGVDMALYHGPQDYLVKFPDGRSAIFPGRPTFRNMRRLNFPVPRNRFKWTILPPKEPAEEQLRTKPEQTSINPQEPVKPGRRVDLQAEGLLRTSASSDTPSEKTNYSPHP
jgi:hypothetical protein